MVNTELLQVKKPKDTSKTFVLYLPDNEVHELGLMYLNYEIISKGYHSIYLGQSVPLDNLTDLLSYYENITFISYFTVKPEKEDIANYIKEFNKKLLFKESVSLCLLGRQLEHIDIPKLPKQITAYKTLENLVNEL